MMSSDILVIISRNGLTIEDINPAAEITFKYTNFEIRGKHFSQLVDDRHYAYFHKNMTFNKKALRIETALICSNGSIFPGYP